MIRTVCIREVAEVIRGVTYDRASVRDTPDEGALPLLRAGNIQDQLKLDEDLVWVPRRLVSERQLLQRDDLVMCTSSGSADIVGKTALFQHDGWIGSYGAFCAVIRPNPEACYPAFVKHVLRSRAFLDWARSSLGANIKNIRKSELEEFRFKLPARIEQQRFAAILDKADSLRHKRQEAICLADDFLRAVFLDMFGDPDRNPKGFPVGTVRDLVASANYGTSEKANETSGRLPILRMNNITYAGGWDLSSLKYVDLDERTQDKYMAVKGDLLFNRTNSKELVGKTAVYDRDEPMAIAGYLVRIRMNEYGSPYYVSGYLNSAHGKKTLQGRAKSIVGMANINAQEMQDIPLLLPPVALQEKYAQIVQATNERLKKFHTFSQEADALHAALSQRFFGAAEAVEEAPC